MNEQATLFSEGLGRRQVSEHWMECRDGDPAARAIFSRHYSRRSFKNERRPKLFVGPGFKRVLITAAGDAIWVWRKFLSDDGQVGVNCAVFRNEGTVRSSELIREADAVAWTVWPAERLYTYVNPKKIRSTNPGACFIAAGWRRCGVTKGGLVILEKKP